MEVNFIMKTNEFSQTSSQSNNSNNKTVLTCEIEKKAAEAFTTYCAKQGKTTASVLSDYALRLIQGDAVCDKTANEELTANRLLNWYQTASEDDKKLFEKVEDFAYLFDDLIFEEGTDTYSYAIARSEADGEWTADTHHIPDDLLYFSYAWFTYHVKDLGPRYLGCFNFQEKSLSVCPAALNNDHVILHEMIHLHEHVINSHHLYMHDIVVWCLYKKLKVKIADLDQKIDECSHFQTQNDITNIGGVHDILFLLKSFDLDLRMGYKLGTVFGYESELGGKQYYPEAEDHI